MVATLAALTDLSAAINYYEADDYYTGDAKAPSLWQGHGADALGLHGDVDPATFAAMLEGKLADDHNIGTTRHGTREHKLGWDMTFSAPKSVSMLGLVAGDRRLLDAHDRAVTAALGYAERHVSVTRVRQGKNVEPILTGKLAVATFPHFTARAVAGRQPDPQLHTHSVILNLTQRDDGEWRSLESRDLYRMQKNIGAIYHMELAAEARRLGYTVTIAKDSTFEIDGVPQHIREAFSSRSANIEAALAERGQTRATASAAQKATIALDTRAPKEAVEHQHLAATWRSRADALGFGEDVRRGIVAQAEARAAGRLIDDTRARLLAADRAVAFASQHIGERDAVFAGAALERAAGDAARGHVNNCDIVAAIARAEQAGDLVRRRPRGLARGAIGFATREGVEIEQRMLSCEAQNRTKFTPLYDRIDASRIVASAELASAEHGHAWTEGQRAATKGLLIAKAATTAIQGSAGTAKTTTVLKTYAHAARARGLSVRALAPTATAAAILASSIDGEPMTVAKLLAGGIAADIMQDCEAWIVDEASMLSARDAEQVLARAHQAGARLVLVGDVDQLGSVEAGRSFGQLQDSGMLTFILDEIVRQTNARTREAVEAMLAGDAATAFAALDNGGGAVVESPDTDTRHAIIARDFAKLSPKERADTLVLDPTREGSQRLTSAIRAALVRDGTLGDDAITATVLEPRGLSRAEAKRATSYTPGDIVTFRKGAKGKPRPGISYRIERVETEIGTVRLVPENGKVHDWQPSRWGGDHAEAFTEVDQEFRAGDRIQFTRNNYRAKRLNGATAMVVSIDPRGSSVMVEKNDGERQMLDLRHLADRHVRPGWVRTIHGAQGATADRVFAHLEAFRVNTVDARAAYVAISRARLSASIYTDSRAALVLAVVGRDGSQVGAIDELLIRGDGPGLG